MVAEVADAVKIAGLAELAELGDTESRGDEVFKNVPSGLVMERRDSLTGCGGLVDNLAEDGEGNGDGDDSTGDSDEAVACGGNCKKAGWSNDSPSRGILLSLKLFLLSSKSGGWCPSS